MISPRKRSSGLAATPRTTGRSPARTAARQGHGPRTFLLQVADAAVELSQPGLTVLLALAELVFLGAHAPLQLSHTPGMHEPKVVADPSVRQAGRG